MRLPAIGRPDVRMDGPLHGPCERKGLVRQTKIGADFCEPSPVRARPALGRTREHVKRQRLVERSLLPIPVRTRLWLLWLITRRGATSGFYRHEERVSAANIDTALVIQSVGRHCHTAAQHGAASTGGMNTQARYAFPTPACCSCVGVCE